MSLMDVFNGAKRKVEKAIKVIEDNTVTHDLAKTATDAAVVVSQAVRQAERVAVTGAQKHGLAEIRAAIGGVSKALSAHAGALMVTAAHENVLADAVETAKAAAEEAGATFTAPNLKAAAAPAPAAKPAKKKAAASK